MNDDPRVFKITVSLATTNIASDCQHEQISYFNSASSSRTGSLYSREPGICGIFNHQEEQKEAPTNEKSSE